MAAGEAPAGEGADGGVPSVTDAGRAGRTTGAGLTGGAEWATGEPQRLRAPAVRPFLLTAGRVAGTASVPPLPIETQVVATPAGLDALDSLAFEHRDIVAACRQPQSLAELAARLRLHLNVVRVLADDLRAAGQLAVHLPHARTAQDISVLRRVIDGLRTVPDSQGARRDSRRS